ncbi:MAG: histidine phosphatase family protein [Acetobacteraceae bacterium]|jgi:broad specificity phosphatase PhoE
MILLRHGQSEFNLRFTATRRDPGIEDARLTEYGHHQAEDAARKLAHERITRIIASPYTRALQTAEPLARLLGLKIEIQPVVRERFGLPCDIGSPRSRLASSWPTHDFSHIEEKWWPDEHETPVAVTGRAQSFRERMRAEADWRETVVVSHWGFILCMTGQSIANGETIRCDPTGPIPEQVIWRG